MKHLFITLIAMLALLYGKAYAQETQQELPDFHYFKVTDKFDIVTLTPPSYFTEGKQGTYTLTCPKADMGVRSFLKKVYLDYWGKKDGFKTRKEGMDMYISYALYLDKNLVPYTYTINILPPKVLQKVSEAELKEFGDILTKLDFSEFIQWDDFTNEQRGVKEPGWAILYSNTKIIYNSDIP